MIPSSTNLDNLDIIQIKIPQVTIQWEYGPIFNIPEEKLDAIIVSGTRIFCQGRDRRRRIFKLGHNKDSSVNQTEGAEDSNGTLIDIYYGE